MKSQNLQDSQLTTLKCLINIMLLWTVDLISLSTGIHLHNNVNDIQNKTMKCFHETMNKQCAAIVSSNNRLHAWRHEILDECIVIVVLQERDELRNIVADILTFALVRIDIQVGHDSWWYRITIVNNTTVAYLGGGHWNMPARATTLRLINTIF